MALSSSIRFLFVIVFHSALIRISNCDAFNCAADLGDAKAKCRRHEENLRSIRYSSALQMDDIRKFCSSASNWLSCIESELKYVTSCRTASPNYENLKGRIKDTKEKKDKFCSRDKPKANLNDACLISKSYHAHAKCKHQSEIFQKYAASPDQANDNDKVAVCRSLSDLLGCYKDLKGEANKCDDVDKAVEIIDKFVLRNTQSLNKMCKGVDYGQNGAMRQSAPLIPLILLCIHYLNN